MAKLFDIELRDWQILAFNPGPVDATSDLAERWCAFGAMHRVAGVSTSTVAFDFHASETPLDDAKRLINQRAVIMFGPHYPEIDNRGYAPIAFVNDKLGHDHVLSVFDKVLADETIA